MKPKRIILIRHGESEANVNKHLFASIPDYTIELTHKGVSQSIRAGENLKEIVKNENIFFYVSPFWRTRSTFENIVTSLSRSQCSFIEEPRLREQEWGYLRDNEEFDKICRDREDYGIFYYRIPGGEAATDVYDRINDLLGSLHRHFEKPEYPQNCVLITHSLAIRLFIMRWYHLSVEDFEKMISPSNGELVIMELCADGRYELKTEIKTHELADNRMRPINIDKTV